MIARFRLRSRFAKLLRRAAQHFESPNADFLLSTDKDAPPNISSTVRFFDDFASHYDENAPLYWPIKRYVSQEMKDLEGKIQSALVVGVGTGQEIEPLLRNGISNIEAIDSSKNMLLKAREKYPDVKYHCADFMTFTNFQQQSYDLICCVGVVEYVSDLDAFIKKVSQLLSPNGLIFLTFTPVLTSLPLQNAETSMHPDYLEFRMHRYSFEKVHGVANFYGLSLRRCFTFQCHIDADLTVTNICFFVL